MDRSGLSPGFPAAILLLVLFAISGCGYRNMMAKERPAASGSASSGSSDSRDDSQDRERLPTRTAVLALRNDSPEPWLGRIVTDAMRREIGGRGNFDFVNDPQRADWVIRGRIHPLGLTSQSFSRFVAALEYGLTLQLDLEVVMGGGDTIRLDSRMLTESDVYLASADLEVTRTNRLEVLRRLSDLLAIRVADSMEMIESPIPDREGEGSG